MTLKSFGEGEKNQEERQLTVAYGVPGQLRALGAGLCLDSVAHRALLPGQHAPAAAEDFHHLLSSQHPSMGSPLNTHNMERAVELGLTCSVGCFLVPFLSHSLFTNSNDLLWYRTQSLQAKFHKDAY